MYLALNPDQVLMHKSNSSWNTAKVVKRKLLWEWRTLYWHYSFTSSRKTSIM